MSFKRKVSKRVRSLFGRDRDRLRNSKPAGPGSRGIHGLESLLGEPLEPRVLLAVDLKYAELDNQPATFQDIPGYVESLISTNFTLRAEQDTATDFFWRLYGTGTDVLPIPPAL